ncbi:MAG: sigma 54-interacting transcriptional regulator [Deltaproteobacteria bacterium]|nr:sigma 54-interacting transcriptional regulator [Deltaproteobacteria bacterium]
MFTVNHRYKALRRLGTGTQGAVYEVFDLLESQKRALKICSPATSCALETEYFHLLELHHPNLAKVFDFQRVHHVEPQGTMETGLVFFTEEFLEGVRADEFIASLPEAERLAAVAQAGVGVARALRMLHSRGMLHLDVKPSNIIIEDNGNPRLIDLGLARFRDASVGTTAGTLGYMAAEVFEGIADEGTDIFALGQVLIQLLSGIAPKPQVNVVSKIPAFIPDAFAEVLRRMTHPMLEKRYSARETILAILKSGVLDLAMLDNHLDDTSEADDSSTRIAAARSTRFIGRTEQLNALQSLLLGAVKASEIRGCVVHGPVGIGKTRLVRKVVTALQVHQAQLAQQSLTFLSGTPDRVIQMLVNASPYRDLTLLRNWLEDDTAEVSTGISGRRQYVSEALIVQLLEELSRFHGPTVVLFEEASVSQIAMVNDILSEHVFQNESALILIFENADVDLSLDDLSPTAVIQLSPLSLTEERQMVSGIVAGELTERQLAQFHRVTAGNPRFVEAMVEQFFSADSSHPLGHLPAEIAFSGDPHQLVSNRLLNEFRHWRRDVLQLLSIAKAPLHTEELQRMVDCQRCGTPTVLELNAFLNQLRLAGYLHHDAGRVSLVQYLVQGIFERTTPEDQQRLHRRLYENLNHDRGFEHRAVHAFLAGLFVEAAPLLNDAAQRAIAKGNTTGAVGFLEMLLACSKENLTDKRLALVICYRKSGRYSDALNLVAQILQKGHDERAILEKAASLRMMGQTKDAASILESLSASTNNFIAASATALLARMKLDSGRINDGLRMVEGVVLPDDIAHESGMLNIQGLLLLTVGDTHRAGQIFEKGLSVVKGTSSIEEGRYNSYLGMVAHAEKRWDEAVARYEAAFRLADDAGDSHGAATYVVNWAAALTEQGDYTNALKRYRNGLTRLRMVGRPAELIQTEANYAQLLLRLGDATGALTVSEKALRDTDEHSAPLVRGYALSVMGESLVATGRFDEAVRILEQAQLAYGNSGQRDRLDYCRLHQADALVHQKRHEDAARCISLITDSVVLGSYLYALTRVLLALQDGESLRPVLQALESRLQQKPSALNLEYYRALAVAAIALIKEGAFEKSRLYVEGALAQLSEFRKQTPALHQPPVYPYEIQLNQMRTQSDFSSSIDGAENRDGSMKQMWMERLFRIAARLNSELKINAQLDIIMDTAIDVTNAERGFLLLQEEDGRFAIRSARNMDSEALIKEERNYSGTIARRAFLLGEPIFTTNAQEDERYRDYRSIASLNLMYIIAVPLLVKGKAQGTIYLDSTMRGKFDGERVDLLKMLANQAAIALTNARLVTHVQRSREQIESLNRKLESRLATAERELAQTRQDLREMNDTMAAKYSYFGMIGSSQPMRDMFRVLDRIAATDIPVVISGESGTGKELVARAIHQAGSRSEKPFVAENCAAIPSQLLESILFGHVRGAFTGAVKNRSGLFVEAHGGTLFLDEIAELPIEMQSKLLRALQEGEVRPVGQNHSVKVDVRILVASNADLKKRVAEGRFREDLYYRLHVMEVRLPPLRDRGEDVLLLANHFILKHAAQGRITMTPETMEQLMSYRWPGNVRQLENEIVRASVMCTDTMEIQHFSDTIREFSVTGRDEWTDLNIDNHVNRLKTQLIRSALKKSGGNRSKAADLLGISRYGLQKMMARLNL